MLTKGKTNSLRIVKYALTVVALLAIVAMCLTACGKKVPTEMEYVAGSLTDTSYEVGDVFDVTGAKVKVTYENGKEEILDVTQEMVGTKILDKVGTVNIPVSYTVDGKTVTAVITIEVADPYAEEKDAAIENISNNSKVTANSTDKGIATIVAAYAVKIEAAGSASAIDTLVSMFESELNAYVDAKNAVLAKFDTVDVSGVYSQWQADIAAKKQTYLANAKSAASVKAAEEFYAAYESAVAAQLVYQNTVGEPDNEDTLNARKLVLADRINAAIQKANNLNAIVTANLTDPADADLLEVYNTLYTGTSAKLEILKYWVFITLTLDGENSRVPEIEELIEGIKTPIDYIYDLLVDGHTVLPKAYVVDADGNCTLSTTDATADLIAEINDYIKDAEKMFGADEAAAMLAAYDHDENVETAALNMTAVIASITNKKADLDAIQNAAVAVINKIAAIADAADDAARKTALDEAWAAVEAWVTANDGKSMNIVASAVEGLYPTLSYTDKYAGEFVGFVTDSTEEFVDYDLDKTCVVTYFVPNVDELVAAAIEFDADVVKDLVNAIRSIIYTYGVRDSQAEITAAQTAIDNFIAQYGEEAYATHCYENDVDPQTVVDAAQDEYDERKAWAQEIVALIAALPANIQLADYDNQSAGEEGALYKAYTEYLAFAATNTADNVIYTDVIDQADANDTTNANQVALAAAVDSYITKKYAEQQKIQSDLIINAAFAQCMAAIDESTQHELRVEILNAYNTAKAEVAARDYVADASFVFNAANRIDTELKDNIDAVKAMSEDKADALIAMIPTEA